VPEETGVTAALVGFAQLLRDGGLRPSPAEVSRFQAAVAVLQHGGIGDLYWAGRACLGVPASSAGVYDAAFAQYFLGIRSLAPAKAGVEEDARSSGPPWQPNAPMAGSTLDLADEGGGHGDEGAEREAEGSAASALELLRVTPFAACNSEEQEIVTALTRRLRTPPPQRPGRRKAPGSRKEEVDLRATARLAMKTQADLVMPAWRQRQRRPRRVVLLIDVSRSMAPYPRLFLHFGYALVAARAGAEVVCFGTRLTRITGLLRSRQPARSLEQAAISVLDWNGGTRITDAVSGLRTMPGVRGALRGATVIICSDGLERGDPADLGHQMYLLSRTCHEITWVNPLAGDERYQPIAGGIRMALPWVNRLMPGHTLAALEDVAATLSNQPPPRLGLAWHPFTPPARAALARPSAPGN
jgi:uncharacterized protein with von Willebrand factor type A (vWA) domain